MDFILPTRVCLDPDIHASTLDNITYPLLVTKLEEETIFNTVMWEWKINVDTCPSLPGTRCPLTVQPISVLIFTYRKDFELKRTQSIAALKTHSQLLWVAKTEGKNEPKCRYVKDVNGWKCMEVNVCTPLLSSPFTARNMILLIDQYRQTNRCQLSKINTTRECFVYRVKCWSDYCVFLLANFLCRYTVCCFCVGGLCSFQALLCLSMLWSASYVARELDYPLNINFLYWYVSFCPMSQRLTKHCIWQSWLNS